MNPPFRTPDCERLRGVDLEEIQLRIVPFRTEPRVLKPLGGEFRCTIRHVPAAEHSQPQHLFRRQLRLESGVEIPPRRFGQGIDEIMLHPVVDDNFPRFQRAGS